MPARATGGEGGELDSTLTVLAGDFAAVDDGAAAVAGVDQPAELLVLLGDHAAEVGVGLVEQQRRAGFGCDHAEQRGGGSC